jgi:hypothetical protein
LFKPAFDWLKDGNPAVVTPVGFLNKQVQLFVTPEAFLLRVEVDPVAVKVKVHLWVVKRL